MKRVFFLGMIAYSAAILFFNDWPGAINNVPPAAYVWMAKCLLDLAFGGLAALKLFGDQIHFDEDEIGLHPEDVSVPDVWLYAAFGLNILGSWSWHGYEFAHQTGIEATYNSIWWFGETVVLFLTYVFYKHAADVARREARKAQRPFQQTGL